MSACPAALAWHRSGVQCRGSVATAGSASKSTSSVPVSAHTRRVPAFSALIRGAIGRETGKSGVRSGRVNVKTTAPVATHARCISCMSASTLSRSNWGRMTSFVPEKHVMRSGWSARAGTNCSSLISRVVRPRVAKFAYSRLPCAAIRLASRHDQPRQPPFGSGSPIPSVELSPMATYRRKVTGSRACPDTSMVRTRASEFLQRERCNLASPTRFEA